MPFSSRFSNLILEHWRRHRPQMVLHLQRENKLTEEIEQAENRAMDLLYHYLSVDNLQYQTAWDLAMQECLLPEETTSSLKTNPNELPPATSE
jgi:hypothetical protein